MEENKNFSDNVKGEIAACLTDRDRRFACLYGMLLFSRHFSRDRVTFQTESKVVDRLFPELLKEVFGDGFAYSKSERGAGNRRVTIIDGADSVRKISETFHINSAGRGINFSGLTESGTAAFTAGVFLTCGSVIDPQKEYHLEFAVPEQKLCGDFCGLGAGFGFRLKTVLRKTSHVAYLKKSEEIEDMLTFMGAGQSTLDMINIEMFKSVRNKANRISNCDNANIDKQIAASARHISDIKIIADRLGLGKLPAELRELAAVRLENPQFTLQELGEALETPLPRGGVNYRLRKISKIAENLTGRDGQV